jgi:hypothetical protein
MANVQTSEVDKKQAPVSHGLSTVKFGNHCWTTHESVKQWVSLLVPFVQQLRDPRVPIVTQ